MRVAPHSVLTTVVLPTPLRPTSQRQRQIEPPLIPIADFGGRNVRARRKTERLEDFADLRRLDGPGSDMELLLDGEFGKDVGALKRAGKSTLAALLRRGAAD